jgi:hypothetical protein
MRSHDASKIPVCAEKGERALAAAAPCHAGKGRAAAFSGGDLPEAPGGGWYFFS